MGVHVCVIHVCVWVYVLYMCVYGCICVWVMCNTCVLYVLYMCVYGCICVWVMCVWMYLCMGYVLYMCVYGCMCYTCMGVFVYGMRYTCVWVYVHGYKPRYACHKNLWQPAVAIVMIRLFEKVVFNAQFVNYALIDLD